MVTAITQSDGQLDSTLSEGELVPSDTSSTNRLSRSQILSMFWVASMALWTVYFLDGLIDSRSAIQAVSADLGRPVTTDDLFGSAGRELYDAWCGHGFRGRSLNNTFTSWIALAFGGFVMYGGAALLYAKNAFQYADAVSRRINLGFVAIAAVQLGLMILFHGTISIGTVLWLD